MQLMRWIGGVLRPALLLPAAVAVAGMLAAGEAKSADKTLRIAISLTDIPNLWAAPDGGFEGVRFGGYPLFDALVMWDLTAAEKPSRLVPGLAESWSVDPDNPKRWVFKLCQAKFHDGSPWNADALIWNLDSFKNTNARQYHPGRAGAAATRTASIAAYGKIDDRTVFIETKEPNGFLLSELSSLFFASPARFEQAGDWTKFSQNPSGTGPYVFVSSQKGLGLSLQANPDYWDTKRIPKTKSLVIMPIPDAATRVAALRSGQVDLIDTLPPDVIPSLKSAGFQITSNTYPHTWLWRLNFSPGSPFSDIRIRKAANLAIDRDAIVDFLSGTAAPALAFAPPGSAWSGGPHFVPKYDPQAAKALLAEAGYGPDKPVKLKVVISTSGGGQMVPLSMNEIIQEDLRKVGIEVTYEVRDFTSMINMLRQGARESNADAINIAMTMQEPASGIVAYTSTLTPPAGVNWGFYNNPAFDAAIKAAKSEFGGPKQEAALARVNEVLTDDAAALLVVHDSGPRALSPKLKGFVQARNWYQDYTTIEVGD
ncbi:MAG: dppA 3 [Tardiphaga sp.]|jgi:ABC-type transport system substrate-binding protein|nr:dppA 3 [Tardiphaga sp.]